MADDIFTVLNKKFVEDRASAIESLASGAAKDFASTKRQQVTFEVWKPVCEL